MHNVNCVKSRTGQPSIVWLKNNKNEPLAFATASLHWDASSISLLCKAWLLMSTILSTLPFRTISYYTKIWICSEYFHTGISEFVVIKEICCRARLYTLYSGIFFIQACCSLDADPYEVKPGARSFAQLSGSSLIRGYRCAESSWRLIRADCTGFCVNCSLCLHLFLDFLFISCLVHV